MCAKYIYICIYIYIQYIHIYIYIHVDINIIIRPGVRVACRQMISPAALLLEVMNLITKESDSQVSGVRQRVSLLAACARSDLHSRPRGLSRHVPTRPSFPHSAETQQMSTEFANRNIYIYIYIYIYTHTHMHTYLHTHTYT